MVLSICFNTTVPPCPHALQVVFKSAAAISGSAYQRLALLAPAVLLGPINLLAHLLPDKPFQQVLEARLMLSSASIALVRQARAALQQKKAQEQAAAAAAGADAVAVVTGAAAGSAGAGKVVSRPRGSIAPGSFLGLLLSARDKAGEGLTDLQMVMQANVFTLAGVSGSDYTLGSRLGCCLAEICLICGEVSRLMLECSLCAPQPCLAAVSCWRAPVASVTFNTHRWWFNTNRWWLTTG